MTTLPRRANTLYPVVEGQVLLRIEFHPPEVVLVHVTVAEVRELGAEVVPGAGIQGIVAAVVVHKGVHPEEVRHALKAGNGGGGEDLLKRGIPRVSA